MEQFLRRSGLAIASTLLGILLLSTAGAAVTHFVLADPSKVKQIIATSGTYDHIVGATLDEAQKKNQTEQNNTVPLNDPAIRSTATQALTPEVIKSNTEQFVDGTYHWLDGSVSKPDFRLDLTGPKQTFIDGVGKYAESKAAGLPACTLADLRALQSQQAAGSFDALNATCLPPGVTPAQAGVIARADVAKQDFLKDPVITADTFNQNGQENPFDKAANAPHGFQSAKKAFGIFAALSVLLGVAIVLLHPSRRGGLKRVAINLIVAGILTVILSGAIRFAISRIRGTEDTTDSAIANQVLFPLLKELGNAVGTVYLVFGIVYLVLAAGLLLIRHYIGNEGAANSETDKPDTIT
jgi:hypothetical protein